jgi:hypothetical protein
LFSTSSIFSHWAGLQTPKKVLEQAKSSQMCEKLVLNMQEALQHHVRRSTTRTPKQGLFSTFSTFGHWAGLQTRETLPEHVKSSRMCEKLILNMREALEHARRSTTTDSQESRRKNVLTGITTGIERKNKMGEPCGGGKGNSNNWETGWMVKWDQEAKQVHSRAEQESQWDWAAGERAGGMIP